MILEALRKLVNKKSKTEHSSKLSITWVYGPSGAGKGTFINGIANGTFADIPGMDFLSSVKRYHPSLRKGIDKRKYVIRSLWKVSKSLRYHLIVKGQTWDLTNSTIHYDVGAYRDSIIQRVIFVIAPLSLLRERNMARSDVFWRIHAAEFDFETEMRLQLKLLHKFVNQNNIRFDVLFSDLGSFNAINIKTPEALEKKLNDYI